MNNPESSKIADSDDLKKSTKGSKRATEAVRVATQVSADACGDVAEAMAGAFRTFRKELESNKTQAKDFPGDFIAAFSAGQGSFYHELSMTTQQLGEAVKSWNDAAKCAAAEAPVIDYEKLARLVVEEMQKRDRSGQPTAN